MSVYAERTGVDLPPIMVILLLARFQSTPPGWEATVNEDVIEFEFDISIHASRVGGDLGKLGNAHLRDISIHASRVGGD